jgi:hypothetical protein
MHIDSIDMAAYDAFAKALFAEGNRILADGVTEAVYALSRGVTWYTQKLFNVLYGFTHESETCEVEQVEEALEYILKTQSYVYEETISRLPEKQTMALIALSKNGPTKSVTSAAFVEKYSLQSASTVQSAMRGLLEKDFVTLEKGMYSVYDIFMDYWIQRMF